MRRDFSAAEELAIAKGHLDFAAATEAAHATALLRAGDTDAARAIALRGAGPPSGGQRHQRSDGPRPVRSWRASTPSSGELEPARERLALFGDDATRSSSVSRRIALLTAQATLERAGGRPRPLATLFDQAIELARGAGRRRR